MHSPKGYCMCVMTMTAAFQWRWNARTVYSDLGACRRTSGGRNNRGPQLQDIYVFGAPTITSMHLCDFGKSIWVDLASPSRPECWVGSECGWKKIWWAWVWVQLRKRLVSSSLSEFAANEDLASLREFDWGINLVSLCTSEPKAKKEKKNIFEWVSVLAC